MGKGTNTTTTTQAPNPYAMAAYQSFLAQAPQVAAANPFQQYGGEFVAPVNAQQYGGIGNINQYAETAQPGLNAAQALAWNAASPIGAGQILQYQNPYTQNVIDTTQKQFNQANAVQQGALLSSLAAQGALGNSRTADAQALMANQQQQAQAPVIAGLENQSYIQAVQTALAEQQAQAQGAYGVGSLAQAAQAAGLQGAGAQVQAGTLEQTTQQQLDAAKYQQFLMQQAFPYQQLQWEAGIGTGVGSQMGGTSTTTGPAPSLLGQIAGLGLAGVGVLGGTGGFGPTGYATNFAKSIFSKHGGAVEAEKDEDGVYRVPEFADGGVPILVGGPMYGGVQGFVPTNQITRGRGAPPPPQVAPSSADQMVADAQKIASAFKGTGGFGKTATTAPVDLSAPALGPIEEPSDLTGGLEPVHARGGMVRGGFGLGSFLHRQGGGPLEASDADRQLGLDTLKYYMTPQADVEIPARDLPQEATPAQHSNWQNRVDADVARGASAQPVGGFGPAAPGQNEVVIGGGGEAGRMIPISQRTDLPREITGTDQGISALGFNAVPQGGMGSSPVANAIMQRYLSGERAPVTVQPGAGEAVPWTSSGSNIRPS